MRQKNPGAQDQPQCRQSAEHCADWGLLVAIGQGERGVYATMFADIAARRHEAHVIGAEHRTQLHQLLPMASGGCHGKNLGNIRVNQPTSKLLRCAIA
jgi:hypothetical protein